ADPGTGRSRGPVRLRRGRARTREVRAARVLDPLGRLRSGARDGRVRIHHPHRARREALDQRHETAADRRLGEVGQRHRTSRVRAFCQTFAERAFRRPLTDEQKALYVDRHFRKFPDPDLETAVTRVVLLVLKSPRFLYREVGGGGTPDAYDVASRISFGLWD